QFEISATRMVTIPFDFTTDAAGTPVTIQGGAIRNVQLHLHALLNFEYDTTLAASTLASDRARAFYMTVTPDYAPVISVDASAGGTNDTVDLFSADLGFAGIDVSGHAAFNVVLDAIF